MGLHDERSEQERIWEALYVRLRELLQKHGREEYRGRADYWVLNDNWGTRQHKIFVNNLNLLKPPIISSIQQIIAAAPGWEVVIAVYLRGISESWPDMGLTIRPHEIIDGLQRQYFPKEFQKLRYEGSRPGTERD